jgi:hypothetical protein
MAEENIALYLSLCSEFSPITTTMSCTSYDVVAAAAGLAGVNPVFPLPPAPPEPASLVAIPSGLEPEVPDPTASCTHNPLVLAGPRDNEEDFGIIDVISGTSGMIGTPGTTFKVPFASQVSQFPPGGPEPIPLGESIVPNLAYTNTFVSLRTLGTDTFDSQSILRR